MLSMFTDKHINCEKKEILQKFGCYLKFQKSTAAKIYSCVLKLVAFLAIFISNCSQKSFEHNNSKLYISMLNIVSAI